MQLNPISAAPEEKLKVVAQVIPIWKETKLIPEEKESHHEQKKMLPLFDNERVFRTQKYDFL